MSVLGIRNEIHDLGIRYDVKADENHALAKRIMGTALMTEASLADWEKKYPGDGQLARDVYLLQHLYAKIDYDEARTKATYVAKWLVSRYPKTWYGKNMMITLAHILKTPKASVPVTAQQPSPSPTASSVATESPRPVPTATTPSNEPPIPNPARTISPNEPVESVPQATATPEPAGTVAPSPEPSTTAVPAAVRSPR